MSLELYSARFIIPLSKRKTVDGIWFLVLIIYVYTADTCLNLLRCVQVYEPIEFKGKRVSSLTHLQFLITLVIRYTILMDHWNALVQDMFSME